MVGASAARSKRTLREQAEGLLDACYAASDLAVCREIYAQARALSALFPRSRRAERVLRVCSVTTLYNLAHRRDLVGLMAHLDALAVDVRREPTRSDLARVLAWSYSAAARDPDALGERERSWILARAEALMAACPRDPAVRLPCGEVVSLLTLGDPEAMIALCEALRQEIDRGPWDSTLRAQWARAVARCTDRLRLKKRWAEIAPWRDALAREPTLDDEVATSLARATRNVAHALEAAGDVVGIVQELEALRAMRDGARASRGARRGQIALEFLAAARLLVLACTAASWRWEGSTVAFLPEAPATIDLAERTLREMVTERARRPTTQGADLLADAIQDFTWCVRMAKDDARERLWHARLSKLAARHPRSAAERYWALSAGSRALSQVERGDLHGALDTAASVGACAARREDDPAVREAHAKALHASERVWRAFGEHTEASRCLDALEALAERHPDEAMLTRLFVLSAKARLEAALSGRTTDALSAELARVDGLVSRAQGAGLGRRVFAQMLLAVGRDASDAPALAMSALARLRRLAAENPRESAIATALREARACQRGR